MIITRDEAIETLDELIDSFEGLLKDEVIDSLIEMRGCIEEEKDGRHTWGGDENEVVRLHTAYRDDLWTDKLAGEIEKIDKKYRIVPCEAEVDELVADFAKALEEELDEDEFEILDLNKVARKYFGID